VLMIMVFISTKAVAWHAVLEAVAVARCTPFPRR
jgi:hypothetical protein